MITPSHVRRVVRQSLETYDGTIRSASQYLGPGVDEVGNSILILRLEQLEHRIVVLVTLTGQPPVVLVPFQSSNSEFTKTRKHFLFRFRLRFRW